MIRVRWLGRVPYDEALALQRAMHAQGGSDHLLLLEHPHVFTLGVRADPAHVLVDPASVGAQLVRCDRGGDVTYHGPGQLVGYPLLEVPMGPGAIPGHVRGVEQVVIEALATFGVEGTRLEGFPGVWVRSGTGAPRKICAVGVKVTRGRSMHGFALNVDPDLSWFERIIPCGLEDKAVTSLAAEGVDVAMEEVVAALAAAAGSQWGGSGGFELQGCEAASGRSRRTPRPEAPVQHDALAPGAPAGARLGLRLRQAGVDSAAALPADARKPPWLRAPALMGPRYLGLKQTMRSHGLVTVCEEAGCPNIYECWAQGTATFMINGERCTRACGFCLVDTRKPVAPDPEEPGRVAAAVDQLGLDYAVVTAVARDDLGDGGAEGFVRTIEAIRRRTPSTDVEVLIPDFKGDRASLEAVLRTRPDVVNHNLETVLRLQRAVRPSANYARSLAVLGAAKEAGLITKSGLILGMGEREEEVLGALADLRAVGVEIVTIGQYLRPTRRHLPVVRWWAPDEFDRLRVAGQEMGFSHVESSPLTRSSYHAKAGAAAAASSARGQETADSTPAEGASFGGSDRLVDGLKAGSMSGSTCGP